MAQKMTEHILVALLYDFGLLALWRRLNSEVVALVATTVLTTMR